MDDIPASQPPAAVPPAALWLGAAGVLPFAGLAALAHLAAETVQPRVLDMLGLYGAVILSFMGGCRWGFAAVGLGAGPTLVPLAVSVLPALYGWAVLVLLGSDGLVALALGFASLLVADIRLTRAGGAPAWWPSLRLPLTVGAAGSLLIAALA